MVKVKNIYWMLAYAFDILNFKGIQGVKNEEFDNAYDLLSMMLSKTVNYQLKRGLYKEYITQTELMSNLKGKILVSDSIKYNTMKEHKLICQYDDFSSNNYLNQIIKSTLYSLVKNQYVNKKYKVNMKKALIYFQEIDLIDLNNINWKAIRYNRNNESYKISINLCYLIIKGLLLNEEKGENKFVKFEDNKTFPLLYEKFVREYYKKHFPSLRARALKVNWDIPSDEMIGFLPEMKTDITLTNGDKMLIIDTKCYNKSMQENSLYDKRTIRSNNLYQIYTYVKNMDIENTGNISGMLLYAKTDEEVLPNQTNTIGKNKISIKTLDLTEDFEVVSNQLDEIVYDFTNNELNKRI